MDNPERDPRFREQMLVLARRGMRLCAGLGAIAIVFYLVIKTGSGSRIHWTRGMEGFVSLVDKLIILVIAGGAYALSYTRFGARHARLIVWIGLVAAGIASAVDDYTNQNPSYAAMWLAVILIAGVGTMPFRAIQALMLGVAMSLVFPLIQLFGPMIWGLPPLVLSGSQQLFIWILAIIATAISGSLYHSRYLSFRHRVELEEAGERITEQAERLVELDRMKAHFFANLSHEFRTPLTLMLGPVEDALEGHSGSFSTRLRFQLQIARRNGLRLKTLINQLLDLSRLEAGRMELDLRMFDLVAFSRTMVSSFSSHAESRQIELSFHASAERLRAAFDADKMEKILTNLLSNALKFTPPHGKVRLSVEGPVDGETMVSVKDTGPGIPDDRKELVFSRFYRAGGNVSDVQAGTGIGLALVRELVEMHGGTVFLESEVGFGSTFGFRLPIREAEKSIEEKLPTGPFDAERQDENAFVIDASDGSEEGDGQAPENAPLILIADDNDDVRAYLRGHLERQYRVVEANDGDEALRLMNEELPALVLSDVMMPGRDGHELCRVIKQDERTNHIPVVLVTARASDESRTEGFEAGADDYLFKPFNAANLLIRVENLIEIRRILRERFSGEYVLRPTDVTVKSAEAEFLERVQDIVENHIGDTNFGVDWLASEVGLSPRQLQRRLRSSLGLSAAGFIRTLRLERAAKLLEARAGTVSEIAYQVGFLDANYFSRLFRQTFGTPPSEYAGTASRAAPGSD